MQAKPLSILGICTGITIGVDANGWCSTAWGLRLLHASPLPASLCPAHKHPPAKA